MLHFHTAKREPWHELLFGGYTHQVMLLKESQFETMQIKPALVVGILSTEQRRQSQNKRKKAKN